MEHWKLFSKSLVLRLQPLNPPYSDTHSVVLGEVVAKLVLFRERNRHFTRNSPSQLLTILSPEPVCASNYPIVHKFSLFLIPGGNLILPPPLTPAALVSVAPELAVLKIGTSSTLPFCKLNAGHTQTPQLHLSPCHAYRPNWAWHFVLGHSSLPDRRPCSRAGRIHERAWRK